MKKLLLLLTVAILAVSLTACGDEEKNPPEYKPGGTETPWVDVPLLNE